MLESDGLIIGNEEVRDRIVHLYPEYRQEIISKTEIVGLGVDTSLFIPVEEAKRNQSVVKIYPHAPFGGKTPELTLV